MRLNSLELLEEAGAGGMGCVWKARHVPSDTIVAVKLLTAERALQRSYLDAFETEVRAIARLTHPRIVRVHDIGRVPALLHGFPAGTPFFVMDWVPTSLDDIPRPLTWPHCRQVLLEVLDALAHVHARGIVHRDVKPSNVLGALGRLRLADFGIAHMREISLEDGDPTRSSGTPHFMAPEQFSSSFGAIGPATDLYATGCLAHLLLTGKHPFEGPSYVWLAAQHVKAPFPTEGLMPELAAWLGSMTAKRPEERYAFAAEAARDLAVIETAFAASYRAPAAIPAAVGDETVPMATLLLDETSLRDTRELPALPARTPAVIVGLAVGEVTDWRIPSAARGYVEHLRDTGLGVAAVRYPRFIGREAERDQLWSALRGLVGGERTAAVWVSGPPGVGKTRLARWVAERAHELGVARRLEIGSGDDLRTAVRRALSMPRGDDDLVRGRLQELTGVQWQNVRLNAVVRWLGGHLEAGRAEERFQVMREGLLLVGRGRPLIVVLDEADQLDAEDVGFVQWATNRHPADRHLFVATAARAAPADQGWEPLVTGPLPDDQIALIIRDQAELHPDLVAEITAAADGTPSYAITLVSRWIERGELRAGRHGFELIGAVDLQVPSFDQLWAERLDQLVHDAGDAARGSLEIAAALGRRFTRSELQAVSASLAVAPMSELEAMCDARGLWRVDDVELAFIHESFRRIVVEQSRRRGTWKTWIAGCLGVLHTADAARRAYWETELEHHTHAARSYLEAARDATRRSETSRTIRHINEAQRALEKLPHAQRERPQAELQCARAEVWMLDRSEDADRLAAEVAELARKRGWHDLVGAALAVRARFARKLVELDRARALFLEARAAFEAIGDLHGIADADQGLGMIAVASADHVEAERLFEQSLQHCQHNRDLRGAAWAANGLGDVYRKTGRLEEAVSWYSQAMGWFEEIGNTYGAMWCTHDIAQAQRAAGDLEAAERGYLAMIALAERIGQRVVAPRLNLGLVRVLRGDFDQARIPFEEVAEESHLRASSGEEGIAHICLLPCDAAAGDWAAVEAGLDLARRQIGQLIDADLAAMTRIAADYAATPRPTLAAELRDFANLIGG